MHAFAFDHDGVFTGLVPRQPSPLEPGVWLLPANATDKEPPACPDGKRLVFDVSAQKWTVQDVPQAPAEGDET